MSTGEIPDDWKHSLLIPKEAKSNINKYRGIAISSTIPKLFDAMLTKLLNKVFKKIIPNFQHGFVTGKSTTTNLLEAVDYVKGCFYNRKQCDAIYFDLSKAFDLLTMDYY